MATANIKGRNRIPVIPKYATAPMLKKTMSVCIFAPPRMNRGRSTLRAVNTNSAEGRKSGVYVTAGQFCLFNANRRSKIRNTVRSRTRRVVRASVFLISYERLLEISSTRCPASILRVPWCGSHPKPRSVY